MVNQRGYDVVLMLVGSCLMACDDKLAESYSRLSKEVHPVYEQIMTSVIDLAIVLFVKGQGKDHHVEDKVWAHLGTSLKILLAGYTLGSDNFKFAAIINSLANVLQSLVGVAEIIEFCFHIEIEFVR